MKTVIIGAVAAGTSTAAKIRRGSEEEEIVLYEKGDYISYSTCGMPYFIGSDEIGSGDLTPRDPSWFKKRFNMEIQTGHEVLSIDPANRSLTVKELCSGKVFSDSYDELVLATGSRAVIPPIEGIDSPHVFTFKTMSDALAVDAFIKDRPVERAVVIGAGFIGIEIFENLIERGIETTIIEARDSILPLLDGDMAIWVEDYFRKKNLNYILGDQVRTIEPDRVMTASGKTIPCRLVVVAAGVEPEVSLAEKAGLKIGPTGAVEVDDEMNSSCEHIKAVGDCAEMRSVSTGLPLYRPMGTTANKTGRIAGDRLSGGDLKFRGVLGTGIVKCFDLAVGITGAGQQELEARGYDLEIIHNIKENRSKYYPRSREMIIKAMADRKTGRLLGVQIIGEEGVDKRLDVFATAMTFGASVDDLFHLDLSYAPPFSTTKDPVMYTGMILSNAIKRGRPIITPPDLLGHEDEYQIIDVRSRKDYEKGHIQSAVNIPLAELREKLRSLDKDKSIITHCNKGVTGNAAQNLLINSGFKEVYNLSGGYKFYRICREYLA